MVMMLWLWSTLRIISSSSSWMTLVRKCSNACFYFSLVFITILVSHGIVCTRMIIEKLQKRLQKILKEKKIWNSAYVDVCQTKWMDQRWARSKRALEKSTSLVSADSGERLLFYVSHWSQIGWNWGCHDLGCAI